MVKRVKRGRSKRPLKTRKTRDRFLIVCEGTRTEINYFNGFKCNFKIPITIKGLGKSPIQVVEKARELNDEDDKDFDQVWCVFDRDSESWTSEEFNNAIQYAHKLQFKVAYSNQAFELWYVLHFCYLNTSINRSQYQKKLHEYLDEEYTKNSDLYEQLESYQEKAIENAEKLLRNYSKKNPANEDPSTTVHLLVKELRKFAY